MTFRHSAFIAAVFLIALFPAAARAACSSPSGPEGQIIYSAAYHTYQYCSGTLWKAFAMPASGAGGAGCTSPTATEGKLIYNADYRALQFCDGTHWVSVGQQGSGSGGCGNIGDICADGTVFIGNSPLDNAPLYATRCDYPRTFDGTNCIVAENSYHWDNGSGNGVDTTLPLDTTDGYDGHYNTVLLGLTDASTSAGFQAYEAATMCRSLNIHGYTDWYLPSHYEMQLFMNSHTLISDINKAGYPYAQYWSSNYHGTGEAELALFTYPPGYSGQPREYDGLVRCIRKPADVSGQTVPTGCTTIGSACSDGTVYAGDHPLLTGVKLYTMTADDSASKTYASASANTGADSEYNGRANEKWLIQNATISAYPAAETCKNSTAGGHNDWYLPSRYELNVLYTNRVAITGFTTGTYWSSTEASNANARRQSFSTGTSSSSAKTGASAVRCIRKDDID